MEYSVQEIKELMAALKKNGVAGLKVKKGDFELELQCAAGYAPVYAAPAPRDEVPPEVSESEGYIVKSPVVGTFYASSAPDKEPFVTIGSKVKKGDVLFIIESMKLMNEVTSEVGGTVTEILVSNAGGVEYGQPILIIKESE